MTKFDRVLQAFSSALPEYYRRISHGQSSLESHFTEIQLYQLSFINSLHLVSREVERETRRLLGPLRYPPERALRGAHSRLASLVQVDVNAKGNCVTRRFSSLLQLLLQNCEQFRSLCNHLFDDHMPLIVLLHSDAVGRNSQSSGIVAFSAKIMNWTQSPLPKNSVYSELLLGLLWTKVENADEMTVAFQPVVQDLQSLRDLGLTISEGRNLTLDFVTASDLKMTIVLHRSPNSQCYACHTELVEMKSNAVSEPEYGISTDPLPLSTFYASLVPNLLDVVPDILHLTKNIISTILKPIFDLAISHDAVRRRLIFNVRYVCGVRHFDAIKTSAKISFTNLDTRSLCKLWSAIKIGHILGSEWLPQEITNFKHTMNAIDQLLHALHASSTLSQFYLEPAAYKVCGDIKTFPVNR